jgi:sec-independent protein translocase protein TatA
MGSLSPWHLILLAAVVILIFGKKFKVSDVMGDVAKGIKSFKKGLADDPIEDAKTLEANANDAVKPTVEKVKS